MDYLLAQILLYLILAALIGFFIGWIIRGSGFESRMLASENQWRSRHHILQSENNQLQAELDELKQSTMIRQEVNQSPQLEGDSSLPFRSRQSTTPATNTGPGSSHPLQSLRDELSQIEKSQQPTAQPQIVESAPSTIENNLSEAKPEIVDNNGEEDVDDLKLIKGIGPKIESTLNELGIYQFRQIANFTDANIDWVNEHLRFKGRIERENWISQAKALVDNPNS